MPSTLNILKSSVPLTGVYFQQALQILLVAPNILTSTDSITVTVTVAMDMSHTLVVMIMILLLE